MHVARALPNQRGASPQTVTDYRFSGRGIFEPILASLASARPIGSPKTAAVKPISNTAFYCCGIRMRDAERPKPICGDRYAQRFMDERGMQIFCRFGGQKGPNASNVARARHIDDLLRARLAGNPRLQVVLIGCGFDSRAFRLTGGTWYELDEPQLISYKDERLPAAHSPNPLRRIAIDFGADSLHDKLQPLSRSTATIFVIEGVTMYVTPESLRATLEVLKSLIPDHLVIADLMTQRFINTYGRAVKNIIGQLGARMIPGDQPAQPFERAGYRETYSIEIAALTFRYRGLGWLVAPLRLVFPGLFTGYAIRVFAPTVG